ncbi:unnamed protein product [Meloidogyne enterolobii]|uniref:Uncharacterized protein n=1 Tax=Meloidogyne enterolobii TaxID=390850 RepID=A0ACB0ZW93_MELEN
MIVSLWVLRVGRKRFEYFDEKWLLSEWKVYREDDCELNEFPLKELFLQFPPTYPWSEEPGNHNTLMKTRLKFWFFLRHLRIRSQNFIENEIWP